MEAIKLVEHNVRTHDNLWVRDLFGPSYNETFHTYMSHKSVDASNKISMILVPITMHDETNLLKRTRKSIIEVFSYLCSLSFGFRWTGAIVGNFYQGFSFKMNLLALLFLARFKDADVATAD